MERRMGAAAARLGPRSALPALHPSILPYVHTVTRVSIPPFLHPSIQPLIHLFHHPPTAQTHQPTPQALFKFSLTSPSLLPPSLHTFSSFWTLRLPTTHRHTRTRAANTYPLYSAALKSLPRPPSWLSSKEYTCAAQGTQVQSLLQEDTTCRGATRPGATIAGPHGP